MLQVNMVHVWYIYKNIYKNFMEFPPKNDQVHDTWTPNFTLIEYAVDVELGF